MEQQIVKQSPVSNLLSKLSQGLLTICTSAVIGCFVFLWNINREFGEMQQRDANKEEKITHLQSDMNKIRLDQQIMKEHQIVQTTQLEMITKHLDDNKTK